MTGIPVTAWLFTRGRHSIRLVRQEHSTGCRLVLYGPGTDVVTYDFADVTECMRRQAHIELNLLAAAYQLSEFSDRRSGHEIWRGPDDRRDHNESSVA